MKQLLIILLLSTIGYGQTVDSVQIVHPVSHKTLRTVYDAKELQIQLNKVNDRYKTDLFILLYYIDNHSVIYNKVKRDEPKPKEIII